MEVRYTTDRNSIKQVEYDFVQSAFGEMLTAWCCEQMERSGVDRERQLCFATFTTYLGREAVLAELRALFPSATMRKIDSKEDIITTPPQRILLAGTQFRIDVWRALLTIERGKTTTYSALATIAGHPTAVRAVATSVGRNPISVIVPCHRIVPASGGVGNYHSGAEIKRRLLEWEAR